MPGDGMKSLISRATRLFRHRKPALAESLITPPGRESERSGVATMSRPDGPLIWIHADPGFDLAALLSVFARLVAERGEYLTLLVTTLEVPEDVTLSSNVLHQLAPVDSESAATSFLDHWRPGLALICGVSPPVEALRLADKRRIPVSWCVGEAPDKPETRLVGHLHRIFVPTEAVARRFAGSGFPPGAISTIGPLLEEPFPPACLEAERSRMARILAARPVWLAMGIQPDELDAIESAHMHLVRRSHRMFLILRPALIETSDRIYASLTERGWDIVQRSTGAPIASDTQIIIADRDDEDGLWYRLAPTTFLGGTFSSSGTPWNPLDAAALGSAILHGPNVKTQRARFDRLSRAGAARMVHAPGALGAALEALLAPDKVASLAEAAWSVASEGAVASDTLVTELGELLDRVGETT